MDNPNENEQTQDISTVSEDSSISDDIQFEDSFDIDDIQKKLNMDEEEFSSEIEKIQEDLNNKKLPQKVASPDKSTKKYVIYIDSENIDYMEKLSVNDRKKVINNVLKEKNAQDQAEREEKRRKKFITHSVLACFTFIICFPILFTLVNEVTDISIKNYSIAKQNFIKLYKEKGKVSMKKLK